MTVDTKREERFAFKRDFLSFFKFQKSIEDCGEKMTTEEMASHFSVSKTTVVECRRVYDDINKAANMLDSDIDPTLLAVLKAVLVRMANEGRSSAESIINELRETVAQLQEGLAQQQSENKSLTQMHKQSNELMESDILLLNREIATMSERLDVSQRAQSESLGQLEAERRVNEGLMVQNATLVNSHEECQRRNLEGQDERQNLIDRFIETEKKLSDFSARLQSAIAEKKAIAVELRQAREEIAGLRNKISEVTESLHRREVELAALNASFKFSAEVSQEEVPVHHQS